MPRTPASSTSKFNVSGAETVYTEDSTGIAGTVSGGDRFGAALAFGNFEAFGAGLSLAVGVPGDDVAGLSGAAPWW